MHVLRVENTAGLRSSSILACKAMTFIVPVASLCKCSIHLLLHERVMHFQVLFTVKVYSM